jgi:metal-sulfur cluster biosynthetic enzyme
LREDGRISTMVTKKSVEKILDSIPDPELGISIVQLGLVYDIKIDNKKGTVSISITLTSMGCPLFEQIEQPIVENVKKLSGVKEVKVELTFEPPWSVDRMTKEAKQQLGFM